MTLRRERNRGMKKLFSILLSAALLAGCGGNPTPVPTETSQPTETPVVEETTNDEGIAVENDLEQTGLSVLTPFGAPALSLVPVIKDDLADVTSVSGPDPLLAAFVQPEPEYDVIVASTNLGIKLHNAGKSKYKLLSIVTFGNLYIVGENDDALEQEGEMACFGEQAVPGLVFKEEFKDVKPNITWYSSVADASAALISGNANVALLAQPIATVTMKKAKENGKDLKIIKDLQKEWGEGGYPQAGVFVREDLYEDNPEAFNSLVSIMANYDNNVPDTETLASDIEACNPKETLGIPKAQLAAKVWNQMNIRIVPAKDVEEDLTKFLNVFGIEDVENAIVK